MLCALVPGWLVGPNAAHPTREHRPPTLSQGQGGGGTWEQHWISPSPVAWGSKPAAVESLAQGESLILLPDVASEADCLALLAAARAAADRERAATRAPLARRLADKMVRLSTAAAGTAAVSAGVGRDRLRTELAPEVGAPAAQLTDAPADLIDLVLRRALKRIDAELPQLTPRLFAGAPSVQEMHAHGGAPPLGAPPQSSAPPQYLRTSAVPPHLRNTSAPARLHSLCTPLHALHALHTSAAPAIVAAAHLLHTLQASSSRRASPQSMSTAAAVCTRT